MKILIAVTSSISAYRIPNLVSQLIKQGHEIITMISEPAKAFASPQALAVMSQHKCYEDSDEWSNNDDVLHIKLAKWCDVCLIAPLTANTLAKTANGICDNLITSTIRALGDTKLILAPAMNTRMWDNKLTKHHLDLMAEYYNVAVIDPVEKILADGDEGIGGLAEDETIIKEVESKK
ncbi:MAG: phosphopantothenoylcysteine decarboxylase [Calditrichaeota bacterium]|nr:MAG: phosphopantothenoylcysteine decarboxylase [Calditrichota bacterium]MBL1205136.1 phosphopantothenoylcysteine decarboxylase [Calditrichota bacterium]NOG44966.1 phosphopantothenoylcysteine decarboxylase [Calditrichota bacterium]